MRDNMPDRLFDSEVDGQSPDGLSLIESRIRASLFAESEESVGVRPDWLLQLADCDSDDAFDALDGEWGCSAEDRMRRMADDLPPVRASLRFEFLVELERLEERRHRNRRVTIAAAFLVTAALSVFVPLISGSTSVLAETDSMPHRLSSPLDVLSSRVPADPLLADNSTPDSWDFVDAFNELESQRRDRLRRGLTGSLFSAPLLHANSQAE